MVDAETQVESTAVHRRYIIDIEIDRDSHGLAGGGRTFNEHVDGNEMKSEKRRGGAGKGRRFCLRQEGFGFGFGRLWREGQGKGGVSTSGRKASASAGCGERLSPQIKSK